MAVKHIPKAQVAEVSRGLSPIFLYMGTNIIPPPIPKPLRIPAITLFLRIVLILYFEIVLDDFS